MTDNVNHPIHYTQGGIECIDALAAATINCGNRNNVEAEGISQRAIFYRSVGACNGYANY